MRAPAIYLVMLQARVQEKECSSTYCPGRYHTGRLRLWHECLFLTANGIKSHYFHNLCTWQLLSGIQWIRFVWFFTWIATCVTVWGAALAYFLEIRTQLLNTLIRLKPERFYANVQWENMQLFSDSCLEIHATTKMANLAKIRRRVGRTQI